MEGRAAGGGAARAGICASFWALGGCQGPRGVGVLLYKPPALLARHFHPPQPPPGQTHHSAARRRLAANGLVSSASNVSATISYTPVKMATAAALVFCMAVAATTPLQSLAFPQRAMMFSGYFGRPVPAQYYPRTYARPGFVTRGYEPQGAMSAFAAGNTVAAGSGFYGGADGNGNGYSNGNGIGYSNGNGAAPAPDCSQCNGVVPPPGASAEQPEADPEPQPQPQPQPQPLPAPAPGSQEEPGVSQEQPALPPSAEADDSDFPRDQPATPAPVAPPASAEVPDQESGRDFSHKPKPAGKPGRKRPVQDSAEDDDDEEEEDFPLAGLPLPGKRRKGQGNVYSSYFPMFFGGFPGGRSAGGESAPGVATAIANSFSTGKGAVATSHATAYGGPHLLGASGSNGYRKNGSKARLTSRA